MTERIRQLLDEAVAGLEPEDRDPVGAVVRRGRAARRRTATVLAGVVTFGLLVGGLVTGQRMLGSAPLPTANAGIEQSATPRVENGMMVAGAMQLPIPAGWTVVTARIWRRARWSRRIGRGAGCIRTGIRRRTRGR
ncbi:hypothetical protein [Actinoplanes sp. NPDC020271]|uniref:hypothetical protein n=1 Tax=Actinoplanes sp. NPDC020271 TaxID=3363896 RepID=UPI0037AE1B35